MPRRTSGTGGSLAQAIQMAESTRQKKMTNWEKHHLTFPERRYAATDAWIALELFTVVSTCRKRQEQHVPTLPGNWYPGFAGQEEIKEEEMKAPETKEKQ